MNKLVECIFIPHSRMGQLKTSDPCSYIKPSVRIDLTDDVTIGVGVIISEQTLIYTHEHYHKEKGTTHLEMTNKLGVKHSPLTIGDDVYIGAGAMILEGCQTLGKGCVIAAGSIVTKSVPSYAIWGGVPASHIGNRPEWGEYN